MTDHFADRLLQACREKGAPVCVGIDPVYERLPEAVRDRTEDADAGDTTEIERRVLAIFDFCAGVIDAVADVVPAVKFQSACFERYLTYGVEIYHDLITLARNAGLIVLADCKRNDIGVSAAHYAAGNLADPPSELFDDNGVPLGPDAMTINSYLGEDGVTPFTDVALEQHKGLFALVRTSNPSGEAIQGLELKAGGTVADAMAELIAELGHRDGMRGASGYSLLGAVVGATHPEDAARLRQLMPHQIFLVPGFGAQGGGAEDVQACFNDDGEGALITASRSVIFAHEKNHAVDWQNAVREAAMEMKRQVKEVLG